MYVLCIVYVQTYCSYTSNTEYITFLPCKYNINCVVADIVRDRFIEKEGGLHNTSNIIGIIKQYQQFVSSINNIGAASDINATQLLYNQLIYSVDVYLYYIQHIVDINSIQQLDKHSYHQHYNTINESINTTQHNIELTQNQLHVAKQVRNQLEQYELLYRNIDKLQSRHHTMKSIDDMKNKIERTQQQIIKLDQQIDTRKKQYILFNYALKQLQPNNNTGNSADSTVDNESTDQTMSSEDMIHVAVE